MKRRAGHRNGYLYKVSENKEYPANSPVKGRYWLKLQIKGQRKRIALKSEDGVRIVNYLEAEEARKKIIAPLLLKNQIAIHEFLNSAINGLNQQIQAINKNLDSIKIKDSLDKYKLERSKQRIKKQQLDYCYSTCKHFIDYIQKNTDKQYIIDISYVDVKNYIDKYFIKHTSHTYNIKLSHIKNFFDIIMLDYKEKYPGWINPVKKVELKIANNHSKRVLTTEELHKILEEAKRIDYEVYLLFLIGITTGLRMGDCWKLRWEEIDFSKGIIKKIPSKVARYMKKPVVIGMPEILTKSLLEYKSDTNEYVLHNLNRKNYDYLKAQVAKVFKATGIKTTEERPDGKNPIVLVGFHSLRHTFISKHAELGTPVSVIQESVGHSNQAMTQHYMQIQEQKVKDAASKFTL